MNGISNITVQNLIGIIANAANDKQKYNIIGQSTQSIAIPAIQNTNSIVITTSNNWQIFAKNIMFFNQQFGDSALKNLTT